jgi:hypothetical protein
MSDADATQVEPQPGTDEEVCDPSETRTSGSPTSPEFSCDAATALPAEPAPGIDDMPITVVHGRGAKSESHESTLTGPHAPIPLDGDREPETVPNVEQAPTAESVGTVESTAHSGFAAPVAEPRRESPPREVPSAGSATDVYEWELFIEAPFPVDLLKLLWGVLRLPGQLIRRSGEAGRTNRLSFAARVLTYNLGLILVVLFSIPLVFFLFSYLATLPFVLLRALGARLGHPATTLIAGLFFLGMLALLIYLYNLLFRPEAWRDHYQRSKVELVNLLISASFFFAGGALEYLISSPSFALHTEFAGSTESTPQWTLFFADKSLNLLFANLPNRIVGPLSDIHTTHGGDGVPIGLLRILLIFGYVTLVRLLALKLLFSKRELFYGTEAELQRYLDLCGKAEAYPLRKVVPIGEVEQFRTIRSKYAPDRPLVGVPPRPVPAGLGPAADANR